MTDNKRLLRSFGALVLALVMMLSLLACGKKPEPDTSKPTLPGDVSSGMSGDTTGDADDTTTGDADDTTTGTDVSGDTTGDVSGEVSDVTNSNGSTTGTSGSARPSGSLRPSGTLKPSGSTTRPGGPIVPQSTTKNSTTSTTVTRTTTSSGGEGDVLSKVPESLSKQKVKVLVWWAQGEGDRKHAERFKNETGISVTYETITADMYQTRLSSMIMSNNAPSCAAMISEWYPQPITRSLLQPIENTGWDFTEEIYATALMDQFAYKGKQYGIALKGSTMTTFTIMFFNKDLLKQRGVTKDPYQLWKEGNWNWDTCLEMAKQCTEPAKGLYGMSIHWQYYWMLSAGQDFILSTDEGLVNNVKNDKVLDAWTYCWDLINTHKVVDPTFTDILPFLAETSALFGTGSYLMQAEYDNYIPKSMKADWGVAPFPSPKGMDTVAGCDGTVWGFPRRVEGDKLQAAAWYLRYWLDDAQYGDPAFYPKDECWEVMEWMWNQKIQPLNSMGVFGYGGEYTPAMMQAEVLNVSGSAANLKSNLDSWYSVAETNIEKIETEMS